MMPVFLDDDTLIGYSAIKAHWLDIGAKEIYCTDTTDVFQEGVDLPRRQALLARASWSATSGEMATANSRLREVRRGRHQRRGRRRAHRGGRLRAARRSATGSSASTSRSSGCTTTARRSSAATSSRYRTAATWGAARWTPTASRTTRSRSRSRSRSTARRACSTSRARPDARPGPVNCPLASTVSAARVVMTMLAGGGEAPNEGHFRPIEVATRPGSMFHCALALAVLPLRLAGDAGDRGDAQRGRRGDARTASWPARAATSPPSSGGGSARTTGEFWGDGSPHPVGQGASAHGDGGSSLLHLIEAATRFSPLEVWEAKNPWLMEKFELAPDSGGPGQVPRRARAGHASSRSSRTPTARPTIERTKNAPWGLAGGLPGRPNAGAPQPAGRHAQPVAKATGLRIPKGSDLRGPLRRRRRLRAAVRARPGRACCEDVREGYVTEAEARRHYPHAFELVTVVAPRRGHGRHQRRPRPLDGVVDADPITTEVIRHGLNSAANQIKRALVRTSFSPVVYEVLDFAATVYDRDFRLLAQAPSLPAFMGTMDFCVRAAVERVGGADALEPGDIVLINEPVRNRIAPPGRRDGHAGVPSRRRADRLHGDQGALARHRRNAPYCTNTTDVFQEGVVFPGVKLFVRGQLVKDVYRMVIANTRMPVHVAGDVNAEVVGLRTGAAALVRARRALRSRALRGVRRADVRPRRGGCPLVPRADPGWPLHRPGPDGLGRRLATTRSPSRSRSRSTGSTVRLDYTNAPDATRGPVNCPLPMTVSSPGSSSTMLASSGEAPNEGHFRPIEVVDPARLDVPSPPAGAVLPLRLVGDAGRRHRAPPRSRSRARARAAPTRPATSAVPLVGLPRGDG